MKKDRIMRVLGICLVAGLVVSVLVLEQSPRAHEDKYAPDFADTYGLDDVDREPPGIHNLDVIMAHAERPGAIEGCIEKNPPEWAHAFLRGETDTIEFPEPRYAPGVEE